MIQTNMIIILSLLIGFVSGAVTIIKVINTAERENDLERSRRATIT